MNIISVYRKQAFITSSRLAARHTELHSSAHIHTPSCGTLPHISSCIHRPLLSDWVRRPSPFVWPPLAQLVFISFSDLPPCLLLSLSKCSPFQSDYAWLSALPLRVGLHLSPIRVLLKHTHRHSPHGSAYCVVHQLTCKPAFIQMYANCILTNPTAAN